MAHYVLTDSEIAVIQATQAGGQDTIGVGLLGFQHSLANEKYNLKMGRQENTLLALAVMSAGLMAFKTDAGALLLGISAGKYHNQETEVDFAETEAVVLETNQTNYVYLTAAGVATVSTSSFPNPTTTAYIPVAIVTTGATGTDRITGSYTWDDIDDSPRWRTFLSVQFGKRLPELIIGDGTNQSVFAADGDLTFVGTAGLLFGEICGYDKDATITIGGTGVGNKEQITAFDTNGPSNGMTPDHTNDHITVDTAGHYKCTVSLVIESVGAGTAVEVGIAVHKNGGTGLFENCHAHRRLSGGGMDTGSVSISGIIDLVATDTIELWFWNETNTNDLVVDDVTLTLVQVGGT